MRFLLLLLAYGIPDFLLAADPYPRNDAIDIRHYLFSIELNDTTNRITGETSIDIRFKKETSAFELDLTGLNAAGQGMVVSEVLLEGQPQIFKHLKDRLQIQGRAPFGEGLDARFTIRYAGIPQDGLIIGRNKFGDRTFFGDNWPDRAHHWLPTIDHPYDKATCEFIVTAPEAYTVVATGIRIEESAVDKKRKRTHWKTAVRIPTKVMVIGVARFAIEYLGKVDDVPLESWVYPQNRVEGFADYAPASRPLDFMSTHVAPYPFEKLANVQSTTRYGGVENAGNIFYYENSVSGKGTIEGLLAHEIAHQWFGDSASEADWYHVWLSEGFATYFTHLYFENAYGVVRLMQGMETDRKQVIQYNTKNPTPIVNTTLTDINKVLNTNTYQKASWVLHMLRQEVGDVKFWEGIKAYYQKYQLDNALTDDFRHVMEEASGKDLKRFFDQWIFRPGHPQIALQWQFIPARKELMVTIEQKQPALFDFDLEIQADNQMPQKVRVSLRKQEFRFPCPEKPKNVVPDPRVRLLFEQISQ